MVRSAGSQPRPGGGDPASDYGQTVRVSLTDDERRDAARTQVRLLLAACQSYDDGDADQYLNIATRLWALLHHSAPKSHAALEPFGVFEHEWHVASGNDSVEENYMSEFKLLILNSQIGWKPRFSDLGVPPPLPWQLQVRYLAQGRPKPRGGGTGRAFSDWWNQVVLRDAGRVGFSRCQLVRVVRNQGGGGHVDPAIDADHHAVTRGGSMGIQLGDDPLESPVPPTIRQIGWEVHSMLWAHLPQMLPSPPPAPRQ